MERMGRILFLALFMTAGILAAVPVCGYAQDAAPLQKSACPPGTWGDEGALDDKRLAALSRMDTNCDGKLEPGEWKHDIALRFAAGDTSRDADLSTDEQKAMEGVYTERTQKKIGAAVFVHTSALQLAFRRMDTDKNGVISREEYMTFYDSRYKRMDKDKNGFIAPDELLSDAEGVHDR